MPTTVTKGELWLFFFSPCRYERNREMGQVVFWVLECPKREDNVRMIYFRWHWQTQHSETHTRIKTIDRQSLPRRHQTLVVIDHILGEPNASTTDAGWNDLESTQWIFPRVKSLNVLHYKVMRSSFLCSEVSFCSSLFSAQMSLLLSRLALKMNGDNIIKIYRNFRPDEQTIHWRASLIRLSIPSCPRALGTSLLKQTRITF